MLPQSPEKRAQLSRQGFGFLKGSEVAASWHWGPALDVIDAFGPWVGWAHGLARNGSIRRRDFDTHLLAPRIVRPEGGVDRASHPVNHHVREQLIFGETSLNISPAVAPGTKLFNDPGRQADRRIGQPIGQRLRPGALDPLVAGFFVQPLAQVFEISTLPVKHVRRSSRTSSTMWKLNGRGVGAEVLMAVSPQHRDTSKGMTGGDARIVQM
jgi:hypothetical protein